MNLATPSGSPAAPIWAATNPNALLAATRFTSRSYRSFTLSLRSWLMALTEKTRSLARPRSKESLRWSSSPTDVWSHPVFPEVDFEHRFSSGDIFQQHRGPCILSVLGYQIVVLIEVEGGLLRIEFDQPPLSTLADVLDNDISVNGALCRGPLRVRLASCSVPTSK